MGELTNIKRDPSLLGYPATLPIEVALKTASPAEIREAYNLSLEDWETLKTHPQFLADLKVASDMVKKEGMSFKLKARMQAEELLATSWQLIHADGTPANVKADLIKSTMRWGGFDNKEVGNGGGSAFNIQINLK